MAYNMKVGIKAGSALVGGALAYSTAQPPVATDDFFSKNELLKDDISRQRRCKRISDVQRCHAT